MSSPYIGEIRMFGGSFAPAGWAMCDGQLMPISENDALFVLLGTMYGGDGQETFGLPDLQGRFPMHNSSTFQQAEKAGVESVTLTLNQIPSHTHPPIATATGNPGDSVSPQDSIWASQAALNQFFTSPPPAAFDTAMAANTVSLTGGSQPHENVPPYLVITFIISLFGIFPHQ